MRLIIQDLLRGVKKNRWKIFSGLLLISLLEILYQTSSVVHLRGKSRKKWWNSKCAYSASIVLLIYGFIYGMAFLLSQINGGGVEFVPVEYVDIMKVSYDIVSVERVKLFLMSMPVLITMTFALLQMVLIILIGPLFAMIVVMLLIFMSAYYMNPLLWGNYSMVLRSSLAVSNGYDMLLGFLIGIVLIIVFWLVGSRIFENTDIMGKAGE